ncbi:hypothetical protein DOTSEDRAFT_70388 [Lecanosticta acicola]|uniref:ASST-domain-containing protein n=1 Tax=Lecanosticta acicola TaxID=111012 RepID=A0AAI8YR98_9PEZI|nr:hypothetical protein DOTSEDRAFT_70388 [Lecanosticta acicola]
MNTIKAFLWHLPLCLLATVASNASPSERPPERPLVDELADSGAFGYYPTNTYTTAVGLNEPKTNFIQWSERCDDGLLYFLTPRGWGIENAGPMILDGRGKLIWTKHFDNKFGGQAYDFSLQQYQGEDYLTFWLGDDRIRGHGAGYYYMLNASYDIVHRVGAAEGLSADLHEFLVTPEGTALMTMYEIMEYDLTGIQDYHHDDERPGFSYIWDCVFQEVEIETGNLIFQWRASEHVNISTTYHGIGPGGSRDDPFDWFHINSIAKDELGNYLVSARYAHSITYIEGSTGDILWTLGGRMNDFMDTSGGSALNFAWQHDARFVPTDTFPNMYNPPPARPGFETRLVTLFDNAAEDQHYEYGLPISRGLLLEITYPIQRSAAARSPSPRPIKKRQELGLNEQKVLDINGTKPEYTVRVIKSYENPQGVRSSSQGSLQILPQNGGQDPKVLVGYGLNAVWTEFESDGNVLCDVHYGATTSWERGDIQSYRTYKFPWIGLPEEPPSAEISDDDAVVWVSWSGATEVVEWILQCSSEDSVNDKTWEDAARVAKSDFETMIEVPTDVHLHRYLRVIALDKNRRLLHFGTSLTIDRGPLGAYLPSGWGGHVPYSIKQMSPFELFPILAFSVCAALLCYSAFRRFLSWRTGKSSVGPIRWRQGVSHRLLGEPWA